MSSRMTPAEKVRKIISEVKPTATKIDGLEDMLRHLEKHLTDDDIERIRCLLRNNGKISAWDELLDVLKSSGYKAFQEYVKQIFSRNKNSCEELKKMLCESCRENGLDLDELLDKKTVSTNPLYPIEEQRCDDSRGNSVGRNKSRGSFTSQTSREWSTDSNDVFESITSTTSDAAGIDDGVKEKRASYKSSNSKGSKEGYSKESMSESTHISIYDKVEKMPEGLRRELCDLLDRKSVLGRDWRLVAEHLNFSHHDIQKIDQSSEKMSHILEYMEQNLFEIEHLVDVLRKVCRYDCMELLKKHGVYGVVLESGPFERQHSQCSGTQNEHQTSNYCDDDDVVNEQRKTKPQQEEKTSDENSSEQFKSGKCKIEEKQSSIESSNAYMEERQRDELDIASDLESANSKEGVEEQCHDNLSSTEKKDTFLGETKDQRQELTEPLQETENGLSSLKLRNEVEDVDLGGNIGSDDESKKLDADECCIRSTTPLPEGHLTNPSNCDYPLQTEECNQDTFDSITISPAKCLSYTLPLTSTVDSKHQAPQQLQSIDSFRESTATSLLPFGDSLQTSSSVFDCENAVKFESDGSSASNISSTPDKRWTTSDAFKKGVGVKGNFHDNEKREYCTQCSENAAVSNTEQVKNDGSKNEDDDALSEKESFSYSEADPIKTDLIEPNQDSEETYFSSVPPCQEEASLKGTENKMINLHSLLTSFSMALFDKMGLGRRPVASNGIKMKVKSKSNESKLVFRQISSNNAVPSENCEIDNERKNAEQEDIGMKKPEIDSAASGSFIRKDNKKTEAFLEEDRHALVIENYDYKHLPALPSKCCNDDLKDALESSGWQVELERNLSKEGILSAVERFAQKSMDKAALLFYFGHSVQIQGADCYILPVDIKPSNVTRNANLKKYSVNLEYLLSTISVAKASVAIVDAGRCVSGVFERQGSPMIKVVRQNQSVLFTSSNISNGRYMAKLLAERLNECEAITSIKDWIAPFQNEFQIFASSLRIMPLPVKIPTGAWGRKLLENSTDKINKLAFFSKPEAVRLSNFWMVTSSSDGDDLESDLNIFLKFADSDNLACYLFYYEGAVKMENGECFLQHNVASSEEPISLSHVIDLLSETVYGPRIIIINAIDVDFDANELNFDVLKLQEVLLMMPKRSTKEMHEKRNRDFFSNLINVLEKSVDIEEELFSLSEKFEFNFIRNCLFNM